MQKDGTLPEEAELDANAVTDWDDYNNIKKVPSTFVPKAVAKAPVKPKSKAKSKAQAEAIAAGHVATVPPPSLLGIAVEGVPPHVHNQMQVLASQGAIPVTTPEQRARQRRTGGSHYGVPTFLADAARFGYISSNLPPPAGFVWRCHASKEWALYMKGG